MAKQDESNGDMTPAQLTEHVGEVARWLAQYQERVEALPVLSRAAPGEIRRQLPPHPPLKGEPFQAMLADVEKILLPGITHWQSPSFFAYFPANTSGPSILGELLSAGLGVQGMLWATSPACTELETHVADWLVGMLGLPDAFLSTGRGGGVIEDSASSAALCAVLAARERATAGKSNASGCRGELTAYTTAHTHSSVEKAVKIAGMGRESLRVVPVDAKFAMRPDALAQLMAEDRRAGKVPAFVCATVGTTSSNAMDPLRPIGQACREHGAWLHVDAAMSGSAAICPELRAMHDGVELADSYCFDAHKWLLTNFDCSLLYVADRRALTDALSIVPEYLRNNASDAGAVIDYRDWQVPLGRRFRALKLWFVIRHYGVEGLQALVRTHVRLAQDFAAWVAADARFELAAPAPLNLVCFRLKAGDAANQKLLSALNQSGRMYLSHTRLDDRFTLRFCVAQTHTAERHVKAAWAQIQEVAGTLS